MFTVDIICSVFHKWWCSISGGFLIIKPFENTEIYWEVVGKNLKGSIVYHASTAHEKAGKKIKELAISIITEEEPQTTPRKRGRPRKIPEKNEGIEHEEKPIQIQEVGGCIDSKNPKNVEEKVEEDEGSSSKLKKELQQQPSLKKSRAKKKVSL